MNSLRTAVALAVIALVAYTNASPCTDTCSGQCGFAQQACELTGLLGGLCQTQATVCATACGSNPLALITCGFSFTSCNALCNTQCGFSTVAGVVDTLAGSFPGGP
ncbi:hypothetical protein RRG08_056266 [Elysia crispata]|uniref:Uncharacterized protein n=1 Tax=Elysia crispata TaxID=231223 RepID=A0AAE1AWB1_9GAST|nr:hypothetical protein RRG08_056266 [Elysia crispata]